MTDVPRITVEIVRRAYAELAAGSPYFIYEKGRDAMKGVALRVLRSEVQIGTRADRGRGWMKVAVLQPDMGIEEIDLLRAAVRKKVRALEDEKAEPSLREGRQMSVQDLWRSYLAFLRGHRHLDSSPRTLENYTDLFENHLGPIIGELKLSQITVDKVIALKMAIPERVKRRRPWGDGRHTANHVLTLGRSMFSWAHRRGLILRNPFHLDFVAPYDVESAERFFEDHEVAQVGEAIRYGEEIHRKGCTCRGRAPLLQALHALRVAIYTGCRQKVELVHGRLDWLKGVPGPLPRLEIPRAKGQRGGRRGRCLYLGPHAVELLVSMDRPPGSEHLLVPGRDPGKSLCSLAHAWDWVAKQTGLKEGSPKAWRHTARTNHVRCGIAEEHSAQLLGHRGRPITDTVYLHRHGPSLVQAATRYELFIRRLMGDLSAEKWRHGPGLQGRSPCEGVQAKGVRWERETRLYGHA